ncbi:MAG: GNAT family N-acetyltransferase [Phycisphaerales bacterium]|nr:GNAT family N-acetyltransferase [Phycisphaerales bacterium]
MTTLAIHRESSPAIVLPPPRGGTIAIREAELKDVPFIDQLQRKHARMVGWFPTKQIEGNIAKKRILIAEESGSAVGYCISNDRYHKHDDCGIVYQLNVTPGKQRGLIGASLIKAVFDRAAYGCKLFCCWCAQDLQANHFWESLGFVPLAFRTGSRIAGSKKTPRIHIFWQRRIRENDSETAYWFPSETSGGAVKENRLVLPIPPGTHWSDAKPAVLPGMENVNVLPPGASDPTVKKARAPKAKVVKPPSRPKGGLWFAPAKGSPEAKAAERAEKPKREKFKNDPKMVEAARELRDRSIEQINAGLLLPPSANGKYDVSRQLEAAPSAMKQTPLLIEERKAA